jgi:putative methanogenesis marker protein 6
MDADGNDVITKLIILSSRRVMPGELLDKIYSLKKDVIVKETCFGAEVSGEREEVNSLIKEVRSLDPYGIFVKERGFPPGDPRRCRATRGGARPGFHQIEIEMNSLPLIAKALAEYDMGIEGKRREKPGKLDVDVFKKTIVDCLASYECSEE